jgi:hypothetical protein
MSVVLKSLSRCPHHPPPRIATAAVEHILAIRDHPPEGLRLTPGPVAIVYYLHKMEETELCDGTRCPRISRVTKLPNNTFRPFSLTWLSPTYYPPGPLVEM